MTGLSCPLSETPKHALDNKELTREGVPYTVNPIIFNLWVNSIQISSNVFYLGISLLSKCPSLVSSFILRNKMINPVE